VTSDEEERPAEADVGVGPHELPWPDDPRLDPDLLRHGDRRNVVDQFRYWRLEAIVEELDGRRHGLHVAIENWQHDLNIGSIVRTANAFNVAAVHIVGKRRWNRRGAMVTDRYVRVMHHPTVDALAQWCASEGLPLVGIDNTAGAVPIEKAEIPSAVTLFFGQEGPGLSAAALEACTGHLSITQYGSTRSINAAAAAAIAMHTWIRQHAVMPATPPRDG
jgi:tRNA G18 (ribose-2'-O)-methylase SpoU